MILSFKNAIAHFQEASSPTSYVLFLLVSKIRVYPLSWDSRHTPKAITESDESPSRRSSSKATRTFPRTSASSRSSSHLFSQHAHQQRHGTSGDLSCAGVRRGAREASISGRDRDLSMLHHRRRILWQRRSRRLEDDRGDVRSSPIFSPSSRRKSKRPLDNVTVAILIIS